LKAFIDALGLGVVDIVSHDVGSFVAQTFAHAYPASVRRLFFFNCAYPGIGTRWGLAENFPELWYQQFHQKDFAAALVGSSREATHLFRLLPDALVPSEAGLRPTSRSDRHPPAPATSRAG
jgi:pimeloyl-ACP methyl ester carboxylesterase